MDTIRINNLSKRFKIYHEKIETLKERILMKKSFFEYFWALNNITLNIRKGDILGVIGPNGSGKTTLLKLIARILKPTEGTIKTYGKVSALLELGAGFHPDLTGRENIFLNGAILKIPRKDILKKFDAIVGFSELEKFIDTPLRNYSSGMQMRLGFSIAVNTDPNILLVDEVLAVGDEHFQRKCLSKIEGFRQEKKTIIFVSHDLGTISDICDMTLCLDKGSIVKIGNSKEVIEEYISSIKPLN